jgi:hypothetical protein
MYQQTHNHSLDTKRENQYFENKMFRTYFKKFHGLAQSVYEMSE